MKVVINTCYGGFGLSAAATIWLVEHNSDLIDARPAEDHLSGDATLRNHIVSSQKPLRDGYHTLGGLFNDVPVKDGVAYWTTARVNRSHPDLIAVIEALGEKAASGDCAQLRIVEIPDGVEYVIEEYDGNEHVAEAHRTWS